MTEICVNVGLYAETEEQRKLPKSKPTAQLEEDSRRMVAPSASTSALEGVF